MTRESEQIEQTAAPESAPHVRGERRDRFVDDPRKKSVMLAILLSVMPGLGQVYVGYYDLAFRNILVVCGLIAILASGSADRLEPVVGLFLAFYWLHNLVDAGRRASFYNQALAGVRPMELPEDVRVPQPMGSLAGGVLLVAVGLVLFANTMFDIPLHWLADWWPLALVGAGAWLILADRRAKSAAPAP
ncbi:MAG: LiaI-LiaF-like domain-containing protein, partial [Rhodospirillaceae bacterium]